MSDKELKPCPFCGCKVHLQERETVHKDRYIYKISCPRIYSSDPCMGASITEWYSDKGECVALWNRRA